MPGTPTPNLGLIVPTVGGDSGVWGAELNADLAVIDQLGIAITLPAGASFNATPGLTPETVYRVTTGTGNVSATLAPVIGKIVVIKKVDAGLGFVVILSGATTIDGQSSYLLANQFQYVRLQYNGATFDIIGGN